MESAINNGMCRCCASEGTFKDLKSAYQWMGDEEVYSEMLRECFDITLFTNIEGEVEGGICEVCVTQLRNASNFKKQVLQTEEQFKLRLQDKLFKNDIVKVEAQPDSDNDSDNDHASEDYSEYEVPIKLESDEPKPKKRGAKASTSRAKRTKTDDGETSKRETGAPKRQKRIKEEPDAQKVNKLVYREKHLPEMKKQWHNLTTLLKYSNATPFKDRNDAGYICAYCFKTYPDPDVLRRHTNNDHVKEKPTYKAGSGIASFVAFLDIVDLRCSICNAPRECLKSMMEHLGQAHDKKFYLGLTDYFQPFKLTNEQQINCCLCNEVFHNMKLLMQHMNIHYRNFICTICGAGFVNSFRLNRHETTHGKKKSSFPCRHCGLVFTAESKKKAHVNTEHKGIAGDSVCQICKARFKNYYQKTRHMSQVHNVEGIKCDMCEKRFNLKSNLVLHMRSVHLKERPYECSVCSMGFFIKRHMLGHYMATHTNERKFKCEVCGKAYATQNSKRKHMKKNHGISKNSMMMQSVPK
ncbi:gastrula zinc finger protein XlCGF26.1-like isoform X4 [Pectinophora gossypiella]|uniref:gastrula zinc finger protein XlCGF26.1-like isoform X4 n=1 Tax=Pectinophora gossypiella TaxID=13191 RepID=UPI00214F3BA0|nr:gastrula zinc finger protein XlCGF26.1-like isoform X4 [Pectinophora gossypiella]